MPAYIDVTPSLITITNIDRLRIRDTYYDAPEPPQGGYDDGIRTTGANLLFLHERFPDAIWHDPGNRLVEARAYRFIGRLRTAEPGEYERAWPFKVPPKPWQLTTFTHARQLPNVALAPCALGTGKTKMALDICADKYLRDEIDGIAIICLNGLKRQWIFEAIPQHLSDAVPRKAHLWKSTTKIPANVDQQRLGERYLRIMAFNVEAFQRKRSKAADDLRRFLRSGRMALVLDESTRIKSYKSTRTKELIKLAPLAAFRMILTGTPVTKGLEDFFTQYQFLDPNIIGLTNWFSFRDRYCMTVTPPGRNVDPRARQIVGYRNQEELIRKIAPVSFMIPDTVLGLPDKRYERVTVELTDDQRRLYSMLRDELVEDLAAHRIENPMMALKRLLRLQQLLCGRYYEMVEDADGEGVAVPRRLHNNRPEVLANILEQHSGQALIWARFKDDIDDIVAAIGGLGRVGVYEGATSQSDRQAQIAEFRRGEIDYMVLNTATGSTGVDGLQCASLAVYYSNSFNREHRWQSEGRIYRMGQQNSTLFMDMVAPGTVDEKILQAFAETADLAQMVMNDPNFLNGGTTDDQLSLSAAASRLEGREAAQPDF